MKRKWRSINNTFMQKVLFIVLITFMLALVQEILFQRSIVSIIALLIPAIFSLGIITIYNNVRTKVWKFSWKIIVITLSAVFLFIVSSNISIQLILNDIYQFKSEKNNVQQLFGWSDYITEIVSDDNTRVFSYNSVFLKEQSIHKEYVSISVIESKYSEITNFTFNEYLKDNMVKVVINSEDEVSTNDGYRFVYKYKNVLVVSDKEISKELINEIKEYSNIQNSTNS